MNETTSSSFGDNMVSGLPEDSIGHHERCPLIPVNEWMSNPDVVENWRRSPIGIGFPAGPVNQIIESPKIQDTVCPSKSADDILVDLEDFVSRYDLHALNFKELGGQEINGFTFECAWHPESRFYPDGGGGLAAPAISGYQIERGKSMRFTDNKQYRRSPG